MGDMWRRAIAAARFDGQAIVGAILVCLTIIGLVLFWILDPRNAGGWVLLLDIVVIMGVALLKALLVGSEFMEIRNATRTLRYVFCSWILITWVAIIVATYLGMTLHSYIHFI
jgi:hypothetical protein